MVSRAREVALYCPYWLVNMTEQALRVRAAGPAAAALPAAAPPLLPGAPAQPLLLRREPRDGLAARSASRAVRLLEMRLPFLNAEVAPRAMAGRWAAG